MTDKKTMTYYPGCSSQGSGRHLDESLRAVMPEVGIGLDDIDDWNCCGASVGHIGGGQLPNLALTGRNLAQAKKKGTQDVVTGCAACYLNTHGGNEKIKADVKKRAEVNEALDAGGLKYDGDLKVRHACEVLVNDVGVEAIEKRVTNPLTGLKVAGYVGCQTVRPFAGTRGRRRLRLLRRPDLPRRLHQGLRSRGGAVRPQDLVLRRLGRGHEPGPHAPPHEGHPRGGQEAGGRRHLDALPALPDQCRDVPAADQREVRDRLQHSRGLLFPADGGRLRNGRPEGRRAQPQHHPRRRSSRGWSRRAESRSGFPNRRPGPVSGAFRAIPVGCCAIPG